MTTAGAATTAPHDIPREMRNRKLVKLRVFASNRFSKYSVRGVDAGVVEEWHQGDGQDHHGERQREIELNEAQAVGVALTRRADHGDGTQLGRHHREASRPPGNAPLGEEVALEFVAVFRAPETVVDDPRHEGDEDRPVQPMHRQSVQPLFVILLAPVFARFWIRLDPLHIRVASAPHLRGFRLPPSREALRRTAVALAEAGQAEDRLTSVTIIL